MMKLATTSAVLQAMSVDPGDCATKGAAVQASGIASSVRALSCVSDSEGGIWQS